MIAFGSEHRTRDLWPGKSGTIESSKVKVRAAGQHKYGGAGAITGTGFGQATSQVSGNATAEGQASVSAITSLTQNGRYRFLSFNLQHGHAKLFCYSVVGCG